MRSAWTPVTKALGTWSAILQTPGSAGQGSLLLRLGGEEAGSLDPRPTLEAPGKGACQGGSGLKVFPEAGGLGRASMPLG